MELTKMKVKQVRVMIECPECEGRGTVRHPYWQLYRASHVELGSTDEIQVWFASQNGNSPVPDEYVTCFECGGEKLLEARISLEELADQVREVQQ